MQTSVQLTAPHIVLAQAAEHSQGQKTLLLINLFPEGTLGFLLHVLAGSCSQVPRNGYTGSRRMHFELLFWRTIVGTLPG